jgi:hypothetical protein
VSHAVNQSLAGRTALIKLLPFTMAELQTAVPLPPMVVTEALKHRFNQGEKTTRCFALAIDD